MSACLWSDGRLYVAREPSQPFGASSVTELIQGIYALDPQFARKHVRNRIFTSGPRTERDWGMVNVSAKTITFDVADPVAACLAHAENAPLNIAASVSRVDTAFWATAVEGALPLPAASDDAAIWSELRSAVSGRQDSPLYARDRSVSAALIARDGRCLSVARNTNAQNRTLHAEINLVQNWVRQTGTKLPRGSRILTTLQPCRMCAGMIHDCAEDLRSMEILFWEADPGPKALRTCLELAGVCRQVQAAF